jgi:hypothetical protein
VSTMHRCCLCHAIGEHRVGHIAEGGGVPLCAEHRAQCNERARKPAAPQIVTLGSPSYEEVAYRMFLAGTALADIAKPADVTLQ